MSGVKDFARQKPVWCPGCGDYAVLRALQMASSELGLKPSQVVLVAGIGCSGFIWSNYKSNCFKTVHGRTLPVAAGVKLANPDLEVLAAGGDGDGYSIGGNHLIHAIRRNPDMTYVVMDNRVYGNTKGQTSPTSHIGFISSSSPYGSSEDPLRPLSVALASGIGFLAQGFSGKPRQLARLLKDAIEYEGFSLVNVLSPCVVFNKEITYDWVRERALNLEEYEQYDVQSVSSAFDILSEGERVPLGVLHRRKRIPYMDRLNVRSDSPILRQELRLKGEDLTDFLREEFS